MIANIFLTDKIMLRQQYKIGMQIHKLSHKSKTAPPSGKSYSIFPIYISLVMRCLRTKVLEGDLSIKRGAGQISFYAKNFICQGVKLLALFFMEVVTVYNAIRKQFFSESVEQRWKGHIF